MHLGSGEVLPHSSAFMQRGSYCGSRHGLEQHGEHLRAELVEQLMGVLLVGGHRVLIVPAVGGIGIGSRMALDYGVHDV